ncbi:hypothetical protein [Flavobacterium sp. HJJ]|uniref:hypothetical protein n=1 Tax=Flavobacterium sp. HJJ TaxID=2783792 RepID=UPI00188B6492|nr:hypothetical protein [Flavobacterium sp. HJJ]MBF4471358.1 hypothetical protein [Flavobacterium sp. HJJ]
MKLIKTRIVLIITSIIIYSCKENKLESNSIDSIQTKNSEVSLDINEDKLKFSIDDTIKNSKTYFFSNSKSKDLFLLTINPGTIESSKSELKIITKENEIIYKESFQTYYFIKGIEEPKTIPTSSQKEYEKYIKKYIKSLTANQYKSYFNKNVNDFFDNAVYPIQKKKYNEIKDWEEDIEDKEFLNEVFTDSTVNVIDIVCFDCDEGGKMIGYSKKNNKVKTLLEHD